MLGERRRGGVRRARVCAALAVYVHGGRSRVWANGCSKTRLSDFPGTAEWGRTGCGPGRTSGCSAVAVCLLPVKDPLQRRAWPAEAPGTVHRNVVTCYATFRHVSVICSRFTVKTSSHGLRCGSAVSKCQTSRTTGPSQVRY